MMKIIILGVLLLGVNWLVLYSISFISAMLTSISVQL